MAQFTVSLDPSWSRSGDGSVELRLVHATRRDSVSFRIRDGETVRTDDSVFAAELTRLSFGRKVVDVLGVRPATPTHDVDQKQRDPLPAREQEKDGLPR